MANAMVHLLGMWLDPKGEAERRKKRETTHRHFRAPEHPLDKVEPDEELRRALVQDATMK